MTVRSLAPKTSVPAQKPAQTDDIGFLRGAQNVALEVAYAPEDLVKIDIIRQQTLNQETGQATPVERSPYGVFLGDGLFYDLNGNLSLVPFMAFFAPIETAVAGASGSFSVNPAGPFNGVTVKKEGDTATIDFPGIGNSATLRFSEGRVTINQSGWSRDTEIRQGAHGTSIDPRGAFNEIAVERSGNRLRIDPGGAGQDTVITRRDNRIDVDPPGTLDSTTISLSGNRITIDRPGLGNSTTITVTADRIDVDPQGWMNTTTISRRGETVSIDPPGIFNGTEIRPR